MGWVKIFALTMGLALSLDARAYSIFGETYIVEPSAERLKDLYQSFFYTEGEVIEIGGQADLERLLKELHEGDENAWALRNNFFNVNQVQNLFSDVRKRPFTTGILYIPSTVRDELPTRFIQSLYTQSANVSRESPRMFAYSTTQLGVENEIEGIKGFGEIHKEKLKKSIIRFRGRYGVPVTPYTWDHLPLEYRKNYVDQALRFGKKTREGIDFELRIFKRENFQRLVKTFSDPKDHEKNIKMLEFLLKDKEEIRLPLTKLLPQEMSKSLMKTLGPHEADPFKVNTFHKDFLNKHRYVEPHEKLLGGDLLVYFENKHDSRISRQVHSSTYVGDFHGDAIVFTKNGNSKIDPYVTQLQKESEQFFHYDNMTVYRPVTDRMDSINMHSDRRIIYKKSGCPDTDKLLYDLFEE